eukprot:Gb_01874 [translate_table: standard]
MQHRTTQDASYPVLQIYCPLETDHPADDDRVRLPSLPLPETLTEQNNRMHPSAILTAGTE